MPRAAARYLILFVVALLPFGARAVDRPRLDGYSSQFIYLKPLEAVPPASFRDAEGHPLNLGMFHGKVLLVNIWATWCAPCAFEMPALDRLQAEMGGPRFAVVAIAVNVAGLPPVRAFFKRYNLSHLKIYLDRRHRMIYADPNNPGGAPFALYALPISYLIDAQGRGVGYLMGAADWSSPQARSFLLHFIAAAGK